MNTYEIRITNTEDPSDFITQEREASDVSCLEDLIEDGYKVSDVEFQHGNRYIVIFKASDEGYYYDIYESKQVYENDGESIDGGQCTSTLSNAIEMALSNA